MIWNTYNYYVRNGRKLRLLLNFFNAIIVIVGDSVKEEVFVDGKKVEVVLELDNDVIDNPTEDEINKFDDTTNLTPVINEIEKTMEIDINEQ